MWDSEDRKNATPMTRMSQMRCKRRSQVTELLTSQELLSPVVVASGSQNRELIEIRRTPGARPPSQLVQPSHGRIVAAVNHLIARHACSRPRAVVIANSMPPAICQRFRILPD